MTTTADDVWRLLAELVEAQKETERHFQETERRFQETERRFQETERLLKEQSKKTDEQIGKLSNRLGEFVEWQIRPAAVRLFRERGIEVHEFHPGVSVQRGDDGIEIDLLVVNDTDAILIEVKSKLTLTDVDEHIERLGKFKQFMPVYQGKRTLGAVGGLVVPKDTARYAYRKGFFVLAQSGENVVILNDEKFKPRVW